MMTQENIGKFIAEKRKEKNMTQEQFAEKLGVTNRSVSRWENGKTMPDYSMFPMICETLSVSISELLEGKKVQKDTDPTDQIQLIIKLIDYEKCKKQNVINRYLIIGIVCFGFIFLHHQFQILEFASNKEYLLGILTGLGIVCICAVLYHNNKTKKYTENEIKVLLGLNKDTRMRTAAEMLQYAKRTQKADFKQYEKAFSAIEEKLLPEEYAVFSMVADSFIVNESWTDSWKPWHIALAVSEKRLLVCGEAIHGRVMTFYDVESFELENIISAEIIQKKIRIKFTNQVLIIEGKEMDAVIEPLRKVLKIAG